MEPVELIEHENTAWIRTVEVTINSTKYIVKFEWVENEGYEILQMPAQVEFWLDENGLDEYDLCQKLDDLTFEEVK